MRKGFFVTSEKTEAIGVSISIAYVTDIQEFQICVHIGNIIYAIGYAF